ncbi:hypothetical protein K2Z84_03515 [Candidatus Binatia bacterium]|nr:hypothetical protein [Candidatus Binatia bacterium]
MSILFAHGAAAQTISPEEAARHVGESVTVEGEVATVVCSPLACIVSFTADYSGLAASIPGDVVGRFPSPRETYANRRVRLRGTVVDRSGRPRIEVTDPSALQVVGGAGPGAAANAASAPVVRVDPSAAVEVAAEPSGTVDDGKASGAANVVAQAPPPPPVVDLTIDRAGGSRSRVVSPGVVTSRMGGPRPPASEPRGESLVAKLRSGGGDAAAVETRSLEQRIDQLQEENANLVAAVQELQERLTVLEQTGAVRGPGVNEDELPYTPDYVVSGEGSTRLQSVKRGWSSERLLRAIGPPLNTVTEANGYMTWYYANGRAVTLDPRGRVASSVGF